MMGKKRKNEMENPRKFREKMTIFCLPIFQKIIPQSMILMAKKFAKILLPAELTML